MNTLATVRSHMEAGDRLTAFHMQINPQCTHSASLGWDYLAGKLGLDFNIPENHAAFMRRLRCSKCGAKGAGMSIIITPGNTGGIGLGRC
jgi:hypothetical protein